MPLTKEQVLETASLVNIDLAEGLTPTEADAHVAKLASQLDAVVGYMDILNMVDTANVEPLYSPMQYIAPAREDIAMKKRTVDEILANAPEKQGTFFVVPPVL